MSGPTRHTVGRVLLDVQQSPEQAPGLEAALRRWQRERLPTLLDQWLDAPAYRGMRLRIDKIELDIEDLDFQQMDAEWAAKVEPRLREAVARALKEAAAEALPQEADAAEQLLFFLQSGRLPWQADAGNREAIPALLRQLMAAARPVPAALIRWIAQNLTAQGRLIGHADDDSLTAWMEKTAGLRVGQRIRQSWQSVLQLYAASPAARQRFWQEVWAAVSLYADESAQAQAIEALEKRFIADAHGATEELEKRSIAKTPTPAAANTSVTSSEKPSGEKRGPDRERPSIEPDAPAAPDEAWPVPNAGAVLLAPFLPALWTQLGWTADKRFVDEERTWLAVQMIAFLCDGQEGLPPEYQLTLPKILCGLPPDACFNPARDLNEAERAEGEALLKAVLEQAPGLGLRSTPALRGSFLWREGLLRSGAAYWQLQVAPETHDILLNRLPWNFQIVKHPWMETAVYVEWQTG